MDGIPRSARAAALAVALDRGPASVEGRFVAAAGGREARVLGLACRPGLRRAAAMAIDRLHRRTAGHLRARKSLVAGVVQRRLDAWPERAQVVVLGAGGDGLAVRLHDGHPHLRVLEVDRPAVIGHKLRALHGEAARPRLRFAATDLAREGPWPALPLRPDRPTLLVAEALLMYLHEEHAAGLVTGFARHWQGCPWSLLGTIVDARALADRRSGARRVHRILERRNQGFRWAAEPESWCARLAATGMAATPLPIPTAWGETAFEAGPAGASPAL